MSLVAFRQKLFNVRSDVILVVQQTVFTFYNFARLCPIGFDPVSATAAQCYKPCPSTTSFADFTRGSCHNACPAGTIGRSDILYGPANKVCFETTCSISNCDACSNNRCHKCASGNYLSSSSAYHDSCVTCAAANLDSDLTNGYGKF